MPPIGQLQYRVQLQSYSTTTDSYGKKIKTWTTYATVWAQVEGTGSGEATVANQQHGTQGFNITIRYRDDVRTNHRIIYAGRSMYVDGPPVNVGEEFVWLLIRAIERDES